MENMGEPQAASWAQGQFLLFSLPFGRDIPKPGDRRDARYTHAHRYTQTHSHKHTQTGAHCRPGARDVCVFESEGARLPTRVRARWQLAVCWQSERAQARGGQSAENELTTTTKSQPRRRRSWGDDCGAEAKRKSECKRRSRGKQN